MANFILQVIKKHCLDMIAKILVPTANNPITPLLKLEVSC